MLSNQDIRAIGVTPEEISLQIPQAILMGHVENCTISPAVAAGAKEVILRIPRIIQAAYARDKVCIGVELADLPLSDFIGAPARMNSGIYYPDRKNAKFDSVARLAYDFCDKLGLSPKFNFWNVSSWVKYGVKLRITAPDPFVPTV